MFNTPIKEIMTSPVVSVKTDTPLYEVVQLLDRKFFSGVPVVDEQDRVVGIISERDLLKYTRIVLGRPCRDLSTLLEEKEATAVDSQRGVEVIELIASNTASNLMTKEVITLREDTPTIEAVKVMNRQQINRIPVVDSEQKLQGIVTRANVLNMIEKWTESNQL